MAKIIATNKKAFFDYFIIDKYQAGIVLLGWEIKSIRSGNIDIKNAFCFFKNKELFLINAHIANYMHIKGDNIRSRKLLLNKNELFRISQKVEKEKLSIIPLNIFFNKKGYAKLEIGLAKHKKKYDKRQAILEKESQKYLNKYKV
ncbi:MAG: SsrA-binding protein [Mycoplasma sp.]|nr:SsrA-binding protein [Mycoplasma sp.]